MDIFERALTNLYNLMILRIDKMRFANLLFSEKYFSNSFFFHLKYIIFSAVIKACYITTTVIFLKLLKWLKVFMNFVCRSIACLFVVPYILRLSWIFYILSSFTVKCSVLKMKCVPFTVYLQGHTKEFRYIAISGKTRFGLLYGCYDITNIVRLICITDMD